MLTTSETHGCEPRTVTQVAFLPNLAFSEDYPPPRVSLLPGVSANTLAGRREAVTCSAFVGQEDLFSSGRYALAEALSRSGVSAGTRVLLPALHCRVMVEPVLFLGAEPHFYPVTSDLQPNMNAIREMAGTRQVIALVLPHYFGFPNSAVAVAKLCRTLDMRLIEDCAHALYGFTDGRLLGTIGHYSFASFWKFLPTPDGAALRDNTAATLTQLNRRSLRDELRGIRNLFGRRTRSVRSVRTPAPSIANNVPRGASDRYRCNAGPSRPFDQALAVRSCLRSSRWIFQNAQHAFVAARRRERYREWLRGVRDLTSVRPLFRDLPEGVVPYAFPLIADNAECVFNSIRGQGLPVWRWEEVAADAVSACITTRQYRSALLQLPCHQELNDDEMDWMISVTRAAAKACHR